MKQKLTNLVYRLTRGCEQAAVTRNSAGLGQDINWGEIAPTQVFFGRTPVNSQHNLLELYRFIDLAG